MVSASLPQGSGEDVLCCVLVAVVVRSADGTRPFADGQILRDWIPMAAAGARLARRVESIYRRLVFFRDGSGHRIRSVTALHPHG